MRFAALLAACASAAPAAAQAPAPPSDLIDYVQKADDSFAWKLADTTESDAARVYLLDLTSQTWQGVRWLHQVQIFVPKGAKPTATVPLYNTGGKPDALNSVLGLTLAKQIGAPVAFLYGIPAQPLFGGLREDALIAHTFVKYLETQDPTWPLLFPMVKSVVRAMDVIQAFAKEEWKTDVTGFVVTGGSKRGWTAWLTAATGDPRVKAIAPIVIDTLNFPVQMKNQVAAFGKPSEMVADYTARNLIPIPDSAAGRKLWQMVDPWAYRDKLTLPKLLIMGTNDPYWPLDAANSYWDDLKGDKWLLYVPNAGHDLRQSDKDGARELIPNRAVNTLSAFCKCQVFDKPMPKLTWKQGPPAFGGLAFSFSESVPKPTFVRRWNTDSETRDFRKARWADLTFEGDIDKYNAVRQPGADKFEAYLLEFGYEMDGLAFTLSTQISLLAPKK